MLHEDQCVYVYNKTKEIFLAFHVRTADSFVSRMSALRGQDFLDRDSGLWLLRTKSIHTFGMRLPVDLIVLDNECRVVRMEELLRPWRWVRCNPQTQSVLELPAHSIFRSRTEIGDQMVIEDYRSLALSSSGNAA